MDNFKPQHVIFTSVNLDYLNRALTLGRSIKKFNPNIFFIIGVVEPSIMDQNLISTEVLKDPISAVVDEILPLNQYYRYWHGDLIAKTVIERCTRVKPLMLLYLMDRFPDAIITYMDPDTYFFDDPSRILDMHLKGDVLLTPHLLTPPLKDEDILENEIRGASKHGIFNLGFISVKNSIEARSLVEWWNDRLTKYCLEVSNDAIFTDQKVMDFAPIYFDSVYVVKDSGWNCASWNIQERPLSRNEDFTFRTGEKLLFHHFSKYPSELFMNNLDTDVFGEAFVSLVERYADIYEESTSQVEASNGINRLLELRDESHSFETIVHRIKFRKRFFDSAKTAILKKAKLTNFILSHTKLRNFVKKAERLVGRELQFIYPAFQLPNNCHKFSKVILSHPGGGGVDESLKLSITSNEFFAILQPDLHKKIYKLFVNGFMLFEISHAMAADVLLNSERVELHHLYGNLGLSKTLVKTNQLEVYLHDKYFLNSTPFSDTLEHLNLAFQFPGVNTPLDIDSAGISNWIENSEEILKHASAVYAPSQYLQEAYNAIYPKLEIVIRPWDKIARMQTKDFAFGGDDNLTEIIVLNLSGPHKGVTVVKDVADDLIRMGSPIIITVIGELSTFSKNVLGEQPNIKLIDKVPRSRLQYHISKRPGIMGWIPSLTGESFSFSFSDFLKADVQITCADTGALTERIHGNKGCWIYDVNTPSTQIAQFFEYLRTGNQYLTAPSLFRKNS